MKIHRSVAAATALMLVWAMGVPAAKGTDDPGARPAAATSPEPALPTTGRLHPLPAPRRLADSRTGLRLPARPVAAHGTRRIVVAGAAGLPRSGVRAVAVVVSAVVPKGYTSLRLGSAGSAPVLTGSGTSSAFAIVPVTSGAVVVRNGAHAADVRVDVLGWFSAGHERSRSGLFKPLAGRTLTSVTIRPGSSRTVKLGGLQDIPRAGVSTVLLRPTVSATRPGVVSIAPTVSSARSTVSLAHSRGRSADLALVRLSSRGTAVIRNGGKRRVSVTLASVGWFTNGSDKAAHGDALQLASPSTVLSGTSIGRSGRSVPVCGRAGIPSATSARPASFVLARATAVSPNVSNDVQVDPAGATPAGVPALLATKAVPVSRLTLLPPSAQCSTRVSTNVGSSKVSLQTYGWFAGGTVLRDHVRILTPSTLGHITSVAQDSVTFSGAIPAIVVGDVLVAGTSPTTPMGLLRKVTGTSSTGSDTTVQTSAAGLGDVVVEGSMSAGNALGAPPARTVRAARATARNSSPCNVDTSFAELSADLSCSHTFERGAFSAQVDASAGIALTIGMDIAWGFVPKVDVHATLAFDAHARAQVTATADAALDVPPLKLVDRELTPIDVQLGPVPVVIVPEVQATLNLTGHVGATFNAVASGNASASLSFDSKTGFRPTHSFSGDASTTVRKKIEAEAKASFDPTMKADLYGLKSSNISVGLSPYVEAKADACTVRAYAGIEAHFGFSLGINHALSVSKDFTFPVVRKTLLAEPWRNCAVWAGSMTSKFVAHYLDDQGHKTGDVKASAVVSLKPPPSGEPPEDGVYHFTGSGSGAQIARQFGCFDKPDALFATQRKAWGGSMLNIKDQGFSFTPGQPGITVVQGVPYPDYEIRTTDSSYCPDPGSDSSTAVEPSPIQFELIWNTPYGPRTPAHQMNFSGTQTRVTHPDGNGSIETRTFNWTLRKTCTLGGTC